MADDYRRSLIDEIETGKRTRRFTKDVSLSFDTIYIGGGTPSAIGYKRLSSIFNAVFKNYKIYDNPEITVECNPSSSSYDFFKGIAEAGVNRVSIGMQSAVDRERIALGRTAGVKKVEDAVNAAIKSGISNISLDLMLGAPFQTISSLDESLNFVFSAGVTHVSAYILTIEDGTVFKKNQDKLNLPNEDSVAEIYLKTAETLESRGFKQYEISNFAKENYECRHNLKYWRDQEYLGLGPAAHSFINGERFYFPRSVSYFKDGKEAVFDGLGGDKEEYIMLNLRLAEGLPIDGYKEIYSEDLSESLIKKARKYASEGFIKISDDYISLTKEGFLISNYIISDLLS